MDGDIIEVTQSDLDLILGLLASDDIEEEHRDRQEDRPADLFSELFREIEDCHFEVTSAASPTSVASSDGGGGGLSSSAEGDLAEEVASSKNRGRYGSRNKFSKVGCTICGGTTKGHRIYGAVACTSCRAFFSRAVKTKSYLLFACENGDEGCPIYSKSWRSCQRCRFRKCIWAGMDPNLVSSRPNNKVHSNAGLSTQVSGMSKVVEVKLSLDDKFFIRLIVEDKANLWFQMVNRFFFRDFDTFSTILHSCYDNRELDSPMQDELQRFVTLLLREQICKADRLSNDLSDSDLNRILYSNILMDFVVGFGLETKSLRARQFGFGIGRALANRSYLDGDRDGPFHRLYAEISQGGRLPPQSPTYFHMVFPAVERFHSARQRDKLTDLIRKICDWLPEVSGDHVFRRLLSSVAMFRPNLANLERPDLVSREQEVKAGLLYRYLRAKYNSRPGEAAALMGKCMSALGVAGDIVEMRNERLYLKSPLSPSRPHALHRTRTVRSKNAAD